MSKCHGEKQVKGLGIVGARGKFCCCVESGQRRPHPKERDLRKKRDGHTGDREGCSRLREPKVGTISVFEEQPGGRCSRRGENKDQSSETESEATRAPQAIVRASAFPRSEMETLEGFE